MMRPVERGDGLGVPERRGRGATVVVGVLGCLALVAALVVAVTASGGDDGAGAALDATAADDDGSGDDDAAAVFTGAADALTAAGAFTYEGTSRLEGEDPSGVPGATVSLQRDIAGEVALAAGVRETVDEPSGLLSERIVATAGVEPELWWRSTVYHDQIEDRPWGRLDLPSGEIEPFQLPTWLAGVTGARDRGEDDDGRTVVAGSVPARLFADFDADVQVIDATVELSVEADGAPHRVEMEVTTQSFTIDAVYRFTSIGGDVTIAVPPVDQQDPTPYVNDEDLAAFDGPAPLGLGGVPTGWEFGGAYVTPDPASGCPSATVDYEDVDDPIGSYLWIDVFDGECAAEPTGEPISAPGFSGGVDDLGDGALGALLLSPDGSVAVAVSTDLALADLEAVLATLGPLDPAATPAPLAGVPAGPT